MIVLIDNYDSFTYNLVQAFAAMGAELRVFRNDAVTVEGVAGMRPRALVLSPGPGTPREAGVSLGLIRRLAGRTPILGVCLGHQALGCAFGAELGPARRILHGKSSLVSHDGSALYRGLPNPFPAGRYHSLALRRGTLPPDWVEDATGEDGEIMGIRHARHPMFGVQFHPESVMTPDGERLLGNFAALAGCGGDGERRRPAPRPPIAASGEGPPAGVPV